MQDKEQKGFFSFFKNGFKKTSSQITSVFTGNKIDEETWEALEERMLTADIGPVITDILLENVKKERSAMKTPESLIEALRREATYLFPAPVSNDTTKKPFVTIVIGVNGAGKTTTIAKLANIYSKKGEKVLLCAADTFRAAAVAQLVMWAERLGVDIIAPPEASDPAAAAFDSVQKGIAGGYDRVIIDTAGRLHTKHNLMEELKKINRVTDKAMSGAPHEVLLVIDGTAGQNALTQAKAFNSAVKVTNLVITKLDGTAKGGIVLNIAHDLNIPVSFVGLGEKAEDLIPFNKEAYVEAIFSL